MTTRREVIHTLVAATGAAALENPLLASAQPADEEGLLDRQSLTPPALKDFQDFIAISEALTGIDGDLLAPDRNPAHADPAQSVKVAYFRLATVEAATYLALKQEFFAALSREAKRDGPALTRAATPLLSSASPGVADLARSILMAWYFGVWYEWNVGGRARFTVVSAQAYTEGWVWRIAEAHAPGYSNLRFGHWAHPPSAGFLPESLSPRGASA